MRKHLTNFVKRLITFCLLSTLAATACTNQAASTGNSAAPVENDIHQEAQNKTVEVAPRYRKLIKSLEPFFQPMGAPKPDEWLASFSEQGQTFAEYISQNPTLPTDQRKTLYVQPLGTFNPVQKKIITATTKYMEAFYNLSVKLLPGKKFNVPMRLENRRLNPWTKNEQIKTGYILNEVLIPNLPADAAALIAFTNLDLFPDKNFNYVFGQASMENRVGVWSLYRLADGVNFQTFLSRTLKLAVHETGHMFSLHHCTKYLCVMSGTNHLGETDSHPVDACPECTAKICWLSGAAPEHRYLKLAEFCKKYGLNTEYKTFKNKAAAVKGLDLKK